MSLCTSLPEGPFRPTLSTSLALPAHLDLLAKAYGIPPYSIVQLAWALVLRCYLGTSSPCWTTIGGPKQLQGRDAHTLQWECLLVDEHRSISWTLQQWQDPSVHCSLSPGEFPGDPSRAFNTVLVPVEDARLLDTLTAVDTRVGETLTGHKNGIALN